MHHAEEAAINTSSHAASISDSVLLLFGLFTLNEVKSCYCRNPFERFNLSAAVAAIRFRCVQIKKWRTVDTSTLLSAGSTALYTAYIWRDASFYLQLELPGNNHPAAKQKDASGRNRK